MPVPLFIIYRPNVNANIHLNHYPKNSPLPQLAARAIFVRSILLYYETSKSEKVTVSPHLFQDCFLDSCHDLIVIAILEFLYFLPQLLFRKVKF